MSTAVTGLNLFQGKTALVTGSASNIGQGISVALAMEGAKVILCDVDPARNKDTAERIRQQGGSCSTIETDLSQTDGWKTLLPEFDNDLPTLFVHSACPLRHESDTPRDVSEETFDAMLTVNVRTGFLIGRELGRRYVEKSVAGCMLFITSLHAASPRNLAHYSASKAGMTMVMKELARDLAPHNIRVNALAPGALPGGGNKVVTEETSSQIPMRRVGKANDIVGPAVSLLSDRLTGYVTGITLPVDGGLSLYNWIPYNID